MKEEKTITCKDVIRLLLGNKWLYLIMTAGFFVVSFVGFSIYNAYSKEYVAFFDYGSRGFNVVTDESGAETTYYIDGEKFEPRSLITKDKVLHYFESDAELSKLDGDKLYENNLIKSFDFTVRYKKNTHKMDDKDSNFVEDKKGYELIIKSGEMNEKQARNLAKAIATEAIEISKNKIDEIKYSGFVYNYENARNYPEKVNNLVSGIDYLNELSNNLKSVYGDAVIQNGYYGGDDDRYYLAGKTISNWQNEMNSYFNSYYIDSLMAELENNGYISGDYNEYIISLETYIADLDRQIKNDDEVLNELKAQRNTLITSVGNNATVESLEIRELNMEIVSLTKAKAEKKEKMDLYQLQLNKLNSVGMSDEQIATYNANKTIFENKLNSIHDDLNFYTIQYEAIAKLIMKNNLNVYFDTAEIVTCNCAVSSVISIGLSFVIAVFAPMIVNLVLKGFSMADGKPIIRLKKEKESE